MAIRVYCDDCGQFMDLKRMDTFKEEKLEIHKCGACGKKAVVGDCSKR